MSKSISELSEATTLGSNFYFPVADTDTVNNYKVSIDTIKNHIKKQLESDNNYLSFKNINSISGNRLVITVKEDNNYYIAESDITTSELNTYKNLNNDLKATKQEIEKTKGEINTFNSSVPELIKTYESLQTELELCVKTDVLENSALRDYYYKTATCNCVAQFKNGYLTESEIDIDSLKLTNISSDGGNSESGDSNNGNLVKKYEDLKKEYTKLLNQYTELQNLYNGLKEKLNITENE